VATGKPVAPLDRQQPAALQLRLRKVNTRGDGSIEAALQLHPLR